MFQYVLEEELEIRDSSYAFFQSPRKQKYIDLFNVNEMKFCSLALSNRLFMYSSLQILFLSLLCFLEIYVCALMVDRHM